MDTITPPIVAQRFMECYDLYLKGELQEAVFPMDWQGNFVISLRADPAMMVTYFIQCSYFVRELAAEKFGPNTDESFNAMTQFQSVMFSWFTYHMSEALRENVMLTQMLLNTGEYSITDNLQRPEVKAEEVFKNIPGLEFVEWLEDTDDPTKPPAPDEPESDPEQT